MMMMRRRLGGRDASLKARGGMGALTEVRTAKERDGTKEKCTSSSMMLS